MLPAVCEGGNQEIELGATVSLVPSASVRPGLSDLLMLRLPGSTSTSVTANAELSHRRVYACQYQWSGHWSPVELPGCLRSQVLTSKLTSVAFPALAARLWSRLDK